MKIRMQILFFCAVLSIFSSNLLAVGPVKLTLIPGVVIQQVSEFSIDIEEALPRLPLVTKGKQVLKLEVIASPQAGTEKLDHLPIELTVTLKDIFVDLLVNKEEAAFDNRGERSAVALKELSRLIDRPIRFKVGELGIMMEARPDDLRKIFRELPALSGIGINSFFEELLQHHFVLVGKELSVGAKFEESFATDSNDSPLPATIEYEIVQITDKEIFASMKGRIVERQVQLKQTVKVDREEKDKILLTYSGTLKGEAVWNRNNAMIFNQKTYYSYDVFLQEGDMKWKMQVGLTHKLSSNIN